MPNSLSRNQEKFAVIDHSRIARAAVLNGVSIPETTKAVLEARGIDVGELEQRIRQNMELTR